MSTSQQLRELDDEQLAELNASLSDDLTPLEGEVEVTGAIDEDSARVFTARATVLTRQGYEEFAAAHDLAGCPLRFESPLVVLGFDQERPVGFADVAWEGDLLVATMTANFATDERLLIETEKVYLETTFHALRSAMVPQVTMASFWLTLRKPVDGGDTHLTIIS